MKKYLAAGPPALEVDVERRRPARRVHGEVAFEPSGLGTSGRRSRAVLRLGDAPSGDGDRTPRPLGSWHGRSRKK